MEPDVATLLQKVHRDAQAQPADAEAVGRVAMALDVHGEFAAAIPWYQRAQKLNPRDFRWSYFLAWVMNLAEVDRERVIEQYKLALAKNPGYAPAHARLGSLYFGNGQLAAAATSLRKALELDPTIAQARRDLGQTLLAQGETEAALIELEAALADLPNDAATLAALAQAYRRVGRIDDARAAADRATGDTQRDNLNDPARAEVTALGVSSFIRIYRAQELMRAQRFQEAVAELRRVEKTKPDDATVHNALGQSLYRLNDTAAAEAHLRRAIELDAELAGAHFTLGEILRTRNQVADAVRHLETSVALDDSKGNVFAALATSLAHLQRYDDAEAAFEKAVANGYDTALLRKNWAAIYMRQNDFAQAITHYEKALAHDAGFVDAHFFLGMCYEKLGEPRKAIEKYQAVLELRPGQPQALERIQALADANS